MGVICCPQTHMIGSIGDLDGVAVSYIKELCDSVLFIRMYVHVMWIQIQRWDHIELLVAICYFSFASS